MLRILKVVPDQVWCSHCDVFADELVEHWENEIRLAFPRLSTTEFYEDKARKLRDRPHRWYSEVQAQPCSDTKVRT